MAGTGLALGVLAVVVRAGGLFDGNPYIVNMDDSDFPSRMGNDTWIINFYSPWCPHCIHFAPTWKAMGAQCATSQRYRIGAVDCVANKNTCRALDIKGFPTIREFPQGHQSVHSNTTYVEYPRGKKLVNKMESICPKKFKNTSKATKQPKSNSTFITNFKTAQIQPQPQPAVTTHTGSQGDMSFQPPVSPPTQSVTFHSISHVEDSVVDAAAAVLYTFEEVLFGTRTTLNPREAKGLEEFLHVVSSAFPLASLRDSLRPLYETVKSFKIRTLEAWNQVYTKWKRRQGSVFISAALDVYRPHGWPHSSIPDDHPGTERSSRKRNITSSWLGPLFRTCKGYTCALWRLFHLLGANCALTDPFPTARECFLGIQSFVTHFFNCMVCRQHFTDMYPRNYQMHFDNTHPTHPELYNNKVGLWVWHAHNRVNVRLASLRLNQTGNVLSDSKESMNAHVEARTKALWPSTKDCPRCRITYPNSHDYPSTRDNEEISSTLTWILGDGSDWDKKGVQIDTSKDVLGHFHYHDPTVLVFLHETYCHLGDQDGCARLIDTSHRGQLLIVRIAIWARVFLMAVTIAVLALAVIYRQDVLLTLRWILAELGLRPGPRRIPKRSKPPCNPTHMQSRLDLPIPPSGSHLTSMSHSHSLTQEMQDHAVNTSRSRVVNRRWAES
ncbi:hypothetical protein AAMO2058_000900100 [Amorphochlora amoebiformis]